MDSSQFSKQQATQLLRHFMDCDSTTGKELAIAHLLKKWLVDHDWVVELQPVEKDRVNVFAYRDGYRNKIRVLLNTHTDTVPPFIISSEDEKNIYGRGSCDAKCHIVTQLFAAQQLLQQENVKNIGLLFVVGEERNGIGMKTANKLNINPEFLIVGEPTESVLALGHKGAFFFTVKSQGKPAHSGYPHLGISALSPLLRVLNDLEEETWPTDPLLGPTTMNVGRLVGGAAPNIVPESAFADVAIRVTTSCQEVRQKVSKILSKYEHNFDVDVFAEYEPVRCDKIEGFKTGVVSYGTDIPYLKGAHKSFLFGAGSIHVAHMADEFVRKDELMEIIEKYKRLIKVLLKRKNAKL